jgi:DNA mismatch endonuclease (patch repair protein)
MTDIVTPERRSALMARIRRTGTKPEMVVRRGLHRFGFRYITDCRALPGRPDIVFPKYEAAIMVHGCFWHGHNCDLFQLPRTRPDFWLTKISGNRERDRRTIKSLNEKGFRVLVIWECALRGRPPSEIDRVLRNTEKWLLKGQRNKTIRRR